MNKKGINNIYFLPDGETMSDWCRRNKIPSSSVYRQLDKGMLVKDACEAGKRAYESYKAFKPVSYKGKSLCSQFPPKAYVRILSYIRKGKTVKEAIEAYENNKNPGKFKRFKPILDEVTGIIYPSRDACAEAYDVNPSTINKWMQAGKPFKYLNKGETK